MMPVPTDFTEEARARRHEENLKLIQAFRLMDDSFMSRVFQDDIP